MFDTYIMNTSHKIVTCPFMEKTEVISLHMTYGYDQELQGIYLATCTPCRGLQGTRCGGR